MCKEIIFDILVDVKYQYLLMLKIRKANIHDHMSC
jgi:hypothetical protein